MRRIRDRDITPEVERAQEAVEVALAATKAALKAVRRKRRVSATTPGIRFRKDGTAIITVKLELKERQP